MNRIDRKMSILLGLTLSFVLSLIGVVASGNFTIVRFFNSFMITFLVSLLIISVIPIRSIGEYFIHKFNLRRGSRGYRAVCALIFDLLLCPIMALVMSYYAYRIQNDHGAQLNFAQMSIKGIIASTLLGFACSYLMTPILLKLVYRSEEIPPQKEEEE